ncbi:MAG: helix-turn-helix transcriptional regulator [Fimbriimonadaceae bacterium]|nr:helix-turn-helix transcriptional regulator [Fimbriimonadaceae bacterium]
MEVQNLDQLLQWILDRAPKVRELAEQAAYSRSHYSRSLSEELGEPVQSIRKRLLLERAAWQLRTSKLSVSEIAIEAGYDSLEGFSRAFRAEFGVSPSEHRTADLPAWALPSTAGIHFHPYGLIIRRKERMNMNITERMMRHHVWHVDRLIQLAGTLSDEQLDQPTIDLPQPVVFNDPHPDVRSTLDWIIFTQEVWLAAVNGESCIQEGRDTTLAGLKERHRKSGQGLLTLLERIERERLYDTEFVDGLCDPPQAFTFGGIIAHILTFSAARRVLALAALNKLGVVTNDYGDPLNWERSGGL